MKKCEYGILLEVSIEYRYLKISIMSIHIDIFHITNGEHALSHITTYKWFWHFKDGCESSDDDERSGRPVVQHSAANITAVCSFLTKDPI